jgi:AraC-like DNA-binding protein
MQDVVVTTSLRQKQIVDAYQKILNAHINELRQGTAERTLEIADFADQLNIHPTHLSNTLNLVLAQSPCDLYENSLLALAKELLADKTKSIKEIAMQLCYDPSNFTKFFKAYEGQTPKQYRLQVLKF